MQEREADRIISFMVRFLWSPRSFALLLLERLEGDMMNARREYAEGNVPDKIRHLGWPLGFTTTLATLDRLYKMARSNRVNSAGPMFMRPAPAGYGKRHSGADDFLNMQLLCL